MSDIATALGRIRVVIGDCEIRAGRTPGSVTLLAVSKTHGADLIRTAWQAGQRRFGESYVQDALGKMPALADLDIEWHFIGPLQSNKTRAVATHFHWVHSVDRLKIARRLSEQRPPSLGPLNLCIEVNVSAEDSKSGVMLAGVEELAGAVMELPNLRLRGLMAVPARTGDESEQRRNFAALADKLAELQAAGLPLDTLSMGMSADMPAAIAEGATMVRIGTAIFGSRSRT